MNIPLDPDMAALMAAGEKIMDYKILRDTQERSKPKPLGGNATGTVKAYVNGVQTTFTSNNANQGWVEWKSGRWIILSDCEPIVSTDPDDGGGAEPTAPLVIFKFENNRTEIYDLIKRMP